MVNLSFSVDSDALCLAGALLALWFYTIWQSYVIEGTRVRLAGLQEVWRETLSLDPAWRYCPAARTVQTLLDSSRQKLPRWSLAFVLVAALVPSREQRAARGRVYEELSQLPSARLQQEGVSIVETAARYVALAALKRSLLVWALAPLLLGGFIAWSVHWQLRAVLEGAPQAALQRARVRMRRKMLAPLIGVVTSASST